MGLLSIWPAICSAAGPQSAAEIPVQALALKALNLTLLLALLVYFARSGVRQFFAQRRDHLDRQIHEAGALLEGRKRELAELDRQLSQLAARTEEIVSQAEASSLAEKEQMIARANQLAQLIRQASEKAADTEEAALRKRLILESLERALQVAQEKMAGEIGDPQRKTYVEKFVEEVARHG